jgi:hypothetical protein
MAFDKWKVSKTSNEPEEFMLIYLDTDLAHAKPFMRTTDSMSEGEVRETLENESVPTANIDLAIQNARIEGVAA